MEQQQPMNTISVDFSDGTYDFYEVFSSGLTEEPYRLWLDHRGGRTYIPMWEIKKYTIE